MQSQKPSSRVASPMNHPETEEWMAYLYDEVTPARREELFQHLANCAACGQQLNHWRASMNALDDWKLSPLRRKTSAWQPTTVLRWAAAAALVLFAGFAAVRLSSSNAREIASLKTSLTRLAQQVNSPSDVAANQETLALTRQTREELVQLLADYSKLNEERRTEDRRVVGLALRELDLRMGKLRAELETVALNTESGFQQTKEGLSTLASYAVADHNNPNDLKNFENKN